MEALAQHEIDVQNKDLQDLRPETKLAQAEVLGERPVHQRTLELQPCKTKNGAFWSFKPIPLASAR